MGLTACGAYPDPIGAVAHKKGQASVTTLANRGPLPFRCFSTARCQEITSAFYSFVVISHMIRHATRLASDSPPPRFPRQLSSKSFRPKLLRTLFALSHATARFKPFAFSRFRILCRHNGGSIGLTDQISRTLPELPSSPALCFHSLTNAFSRNPFLLIVIQIAGGLGVSLCLTKRISRGSIRLSSQNPGLPLLSSR